MAKLDDYEVKGAPQQLRDFIDDTRSIINFGTFQFPVLSTVPTFTADTGRLVLFRSGTAGRIYVNLGFRWDVAVAFVASTA